MLLSFKVSVWTETDSAEPKWRAKQASLVYLTELFHNRIFISTLTHSFVDAFSGLFEVINLEQKI